ncbi:MAG: DUF6020 family protein, partial [Candidatus Saccharibacteria bacterium]|nr:DUF6020 family protein [Candidatus Saccharibacteria bacterium]
NNINIGIAMFNIFQIFVISSAFSYAITTLRQIGISKKSALVLAIVLAIMPYNIIYSFTVWKDIIFGASFLIFIVAIYRYLNQLTKHEKMLLSTIAISGITICLFRSNALIAFFATTVIFLIIFKKRYLKLGILLCGIVCLSFILKNPVLKASNIPQPDIVESLAIPMQQITRVLTEKNLPEDDIALISNVANPNQLRASYVPYIHDPLKYIVRMNGNKNYISEHKIDFLALYLKLGIKYPWQYTKAWIDQTKGYWNAGYRYWRWADEIAANDYGIDRSTVSSKIKNLFSTYLQIFDKFDFLSPLISIGFAAWILIVIFFLSLKKKDRTAMILAIFLLTTWGTLLIATPVFSEFRYVYFLFTCIPFLSIATLIKSRRKALHEKK